MHPVLISALIDSPPSSFELGGCSVGDREMTSRRSTTVLIALASAAVVFTAADTQAQTYNWSGFYVGVNAGVAWGNSDAKTTADCPATGGYFCDATIVNGLGNAAAVSASGTGSSSTSDFTGGIQTGYNLQSGNFVYGAEIDFSAFNLKASRSSSGIYPSVPAFSHTVTSSIDSDWLFTARGRLGWATSNWLIYATAGLAMTDLRGGNSFVDTVFPTVLQAGSSAGLKTDWKSDLKTGWTAGGGVEWALNRNWTVKGEYLYMDFGSVSAASIPTYTSLVAPFTRTNVVSTSSDLTAHIARVGINYRF
jgi:outer membrane immunogenic protein